MNILQKENQKEHCRMLGVTLYLSIQEAVITPNLITPVLVPLEKSSFNLKISFICTIHSNGCIGITCGGGKDRNTNKFICQDF